MVDEHTGAEREFWTRLVLVLEANFASLQAEQSATRKHCPSPN